MFSPGKIGITIVIWYLDHYDVTEYFGHVSLERFCKIICQHHLCWAILNFHFPFIYSVLGKKYLIFICLEFSLQWLLPLFSILIVFYLCWYAILSNIPYPCPCKNSLAINCRAYIHSHQIAPPSWRFLYSTFALTLFVKHYMYHSDGSSSVTSHVSMDRVSCINPRVHICKNLLSNYSIFIRGIFYPW